MADIPIDFEGEELDITYELVKGEEQSDIAGSSDQINVHSVKQDGKDYSFKNGHYALHRIEEIIFEQIK